MTRTELIQSFCDQYEDCRYLEIGVQGGHNFNKIKAKYKTGVDPDPDSKATTHTTSNNFFYFLSQVVVVPNENFDKTEYDVIFIDGLHESNQVYDDIRNSLNYLSEGGVIVCHDMMPPNKEAQIVPRQTKVWTGDCWKAWVKLRQEREDLEMYVIPHDFGLGVIRRGKQERLLVDVPVTYENFVKNMDEWLNIKRA